MSREYHSPSSIALGRRCQRAWAYCYIDGLRRPDVAWREDLQGRDRSLALGKAMHAVLEGYYRGTPTDWFTFPGQVAQSGLPFLPEPSPGVAPELSVGAKEGHPLGYTLADGTRRAITAGGVLWHGFVDLQAPGRVWDYKSTADIERYAKSRAELEADVQANLYGLDVALAHGADQAVMTWVYFETKRVRRARPVNFTVTVTRATDILEAAAEDAKALDLIERSSDAPMNTSACHDYGGCEHHHSVGGPCSARVNYGALIQARVPTKEGQSIMPLSEAARASIGAIGAKPNMAFKPVGLAPLKAAPPPPADEPAETVVDVAEAVAPVAAAPAPKAKAPKAKGAKPTDGSLSATLSGHVTALAAAELARDEAQAAVDAATTALREALG